MSDAPHEESGQASTSRERNRGKARGLTTPSHEIEPAVRVLCVDDHAVLIAGLMAHFSIEKRVEIVAQLSNAEGLLEEVERSKPEVVLLDIEMPGPDVFEMADQLHHRYPDVKFVFLSAFVRDGYLAAAYKCGASGYFAKSDELEDIEAGIRELAENTGGTFVMGPKVREHSARAAVPSHHRHAAGHNATQDTLPKTSLESLTTREIEVLRLIGKGLSRTEIAKELSRSPKTIDGHQERIMKKLGIDSRAELMRYAIREGLAEA